MVPINPGTMADIVFEGDEPNSHLHTTIYQVDDRCVILSQTTPPIIHDQKGKRLLVTFLEKDKGSNARYGFWAKLTGLVPDFEITSSQRVPALVLETLTDLKPYDFRMSYRIKPLPNKGLGAFFQGGAVTIQDISVGGIRISTGTNCSFDLGDVLTLTINVDDKRFEIEGRVINVSPSSRPGTTPGQQQVAIQFMSHPKERETVLGEKIFRLDRERLAQGMR